MGDLAKYYDLIYAWKDYKKEAGRIKSIIKQYKKSKGKELLEVACGTGSYLEYLHKDFQSIGLDLNEGMLRIARKKLPKVKFIKASMIDFELNKKFDIIVCLFSSIGYVKSYENLRKTIINLSNHLKDGGIIIIEPWFAKSEYKVGSPHLTTYDGKDIKIARLSVSKIKGNISILDMHYAVAERNKDVKHFVSREELGMFENAKILELMRNASLSAKILKNMSWDKRRNLFIGVKQ